jgi:hypothetical protein
MGAGKTVKGGIELVETFLKELNKPAKAAVKVTEVVAAPKAIKGAQDILPTAEREANLAEFLEGSAAKNRLYHGTGSDIQAFDKSKIKRPMFGEGFHLGESPALASFYAGQFKEGQNVMPVYAAIKKPFELKDMSKWYDIPGSTDAEKTAWIKSQGYDGIKYNHGAPYNAPNESGVGWVAFEPNQIKSAIGNRGTYDKSHKDIVKATGGEVHMMGGGRPPKKTTLEEDLKSFKDPAIGLADLLAGLGRGTTAAATGIAGDLEELYRQYGKGAVANAVRLMLPKREGKATTFPTIEEMNAMLPPVVPAGAGRSAQMADVGQFFGENNPLAPAAGELGVRAVKAALPLAKKAGQAAKKAATSDDLAYALENLESKMGLGPKQIMIGPKAKTFRHDDAALAAQMEKEGKDRNEIWQATKTMRAPDNQLKQELHDWWMEYTDKNATGRQGEAAYKRYQQAIDRANANGADPEEIKEINDWWNKTKQDAYINSKGTVGEYVNHPELKAAYPQLFEQILKQIEPTHPEWVMPQDFGGSYSPSDKSIAINTRLGEEPRRSVALHELQHAIQDIEGWQSGSSPAYMGYKLAERDVFNDAVQKQQELLDSLSPTSILRPSVEKSLQEAKENLKPYELLEGLTPNEAYRRASGEEEARMTQKRLGLTAREREQRPPFMDYEADPSLHITDFADGGAVMMGAGGVAKKALEKATPVVDKAIKNLAEGLRGYIDPIATKISEWNWRPMTDVRQEVPDTEVPEYIQKGYGDFMAEQAKRAAAGDLNARDLIKAYTITRSSVNRGGLPYNTATKTGMQLPRTQGLVRPEGAFAEWLGSKAGQRYLDQAVKGTFTESDFEDMVTRFAPFGMPAVLADDMRYAARSLSPKGATISSDVMASPEVYREVSQQLKGIGPAKSGFMASLLGRGDYPTFDARQIRLHTGQGGKDATKYMTRGKGVGGEEAVARLADRQRAMDMSLDPSLDPFYQHLVHHTVWDKLGNEQTTHDDLVKAMRGYADGGEIDLDGVTLDDFLSKQGY